VPDAPEVHVTVVLAIGRLFEIGAGGAWPVRRGRTVLLDYALDDVVKEHDVVLPDALAFGWCDRFLERQPVGPDLPARFDLVVAAPEHDAGMIAEALYLLDGLFAHVLLKRQVTGHHVAAEHELLPNHKAQLVADVVEVVALVNAAAPLAHHVHVGIARGL